MIIRISDTSPDAAVEQAEYQRLLGYPRGRVLEERALELSERARAWYERHGRPWVYAREAASVELVAGRIVIEGVPFTSRRLHDRLLEAGADRVVLVAVSAGPQLECETQRLWLDGRPDEYFFLEVYGSAVVEHLALTTGARLCGVAERHGHAVLPHYSPGYPEWDIEEQAALLALLPGAGEALTGPIEVLQSGMLRPKKSLLAVFGLTRHRERVRPLTDLVPCENCSLRGCQYRRARYHRHGLPSEMEGLAPAAAAARVAEVQDPARSPLRLDARYTVNERALRRWAEERVSLEPHSDGTTLALFRYDGTTCSNMGRPFSFLYSVRLGRREDGYPVLEQHCAPVPGDEGHTFMCRYRTSGKRLLRAIEEEKPLAGRPLDEVLAWHRAPVGPTCYCDRASRTHKWGLALETIHYVLARREELLREPPTPQETGVG